MNKRISIVDEITYDDVLIKPKYSTIKSRKNTNLSMKLTKNITLTFPIISSNMDTITEDKMAIAMAKYGGMGIIHRYCSIEEQSNMVKNVKRYTNHIISNPWAVPKNTTIEEAINIIKTNKVGSLLITELEDKQLIGILTKRDINRFILNRSFYEKEYFTDLEHVTVEDFMTTIDSIVLHKTTKQKLNSINEKEILKL